MVLRYVCVYLHISGIVSHISLYSCIFTAYLLYFVHIFASCWLFQLILCNTYPSSAGPFLFHSCSTSQQKLQINSSLPVNTLTARVRQTSCQPGPKVRPSQLEGLQLLAHSLLACRLPFPPSAPIGEPNQPGRHPAGTMQCLSLQLLQQPLQQGFYIVFCCLAARLVEASPGKSDFSVELFLESADFDGSPASSRWLDNYARPCIKSNRTTIKGADALPYIKLAAGHQAPCINNTRARVRVPNLAND